MPGSSNSSFIPKRDQTAVPNTIRRRRVFSVFHILATVAILVSLVVAGGAYVYKQQLISKKAELGAELAKQQEALSSADIADVQNFDRRLRAAEFLIENHLAPSRLFAALERSTLSRVEYSSFTYTNDPGSDASLELMGVTGEFATIALQAQSFRNEPLLEDALIASLTAMGISEEEGVTVERVGFEVLTTLEQDKLRYTGSAGDTVTRSVPTTATEQVAAGTPLDSVAVSPMN